MTFKSTLTALLLSVAALATTGCNTVRGIAADIDSVGRAGERAID